MARAAATPAKTGLKKVPIMAWLLGAAGTAAFIRAVWNPYRAVVKSGEAAACPGRDAGGVCNSTIVIKAEPGTPVYAVGHGKVVSTGADWTHIELGGEPVILYYSIPTDLAEGKTVWRGKKIGTVPDDGMLEFGVWEVTQQGVVPIEPAAWLAARGYKLASKLTGAGDKWCEQPRKLVIPKSVHEAPANGGCGLRLPEAASFGLLPVSIQEE